MDLHHQKYILAHLDKLVQCTTCNALLLAKLRLHGVLGANDCDSLDALKFEGKMSQSLKLYEVVITRTDPFDLLALALRETGQTEAARILFEGSESFQAISQLFYEDNKSLKSSGQQLISNRMDEGSLQTLVIEAFENITTTLHFLKEKKNVTIVSTIDLTLTSTILKMVLDKESTCFSTYSSNYKDQDQCQADNTLIVIVASNFEEFIANFKVIDNKRILITTLKLHEVLEALKLSTNTDLSRNARISKHSLKWDDLKHSFRETVLKRLVKFQEYEVSLRDLLNPHHLEISSDLLRNNINEKLLLELLYDQKPLLCFKTIPPLPQKCYVQRSFSKKYAIKSFSIFKDDVVVVSGGRQFDVKIAIEKWNIKVVEKTKEVESLDRTCSIILISNKYETNDKEMFQAISKHLSRPTHWFTFAGTHFEHCMSLGLKPCSQSWELVEEIEAAKNSGSTIFGGEILGQVGNCRDSIITVFGPSGSGKSVVLSKLAETISSANPTHFVGFFVLNELVQSVQSQVGFGELQIGDVVSAMMSSCSNYALTKRLLELRFCEIIKDTTNTNVDIFLDGLDEVTPTLTHFSIQVLLELRRSMKHARIWLSTSIEYLEFLQDCPSLKIVQLQLEPLSSHDLLSFLVKSWRVETLQKSTSFTTCATDCLKSLPRNMNLPKDIPPLSLLVLSNFAELFKDSALDYSELIELSEISSLKNYPLPSSLVELYSQIFNLRMNAHLLRISIISSSEGGWYTRGRIKRLHMLLALQQLFPDWTHTFRTYFEHERRGSFTDILPFGLVFQTGNGKSFRFAHRSTAEYFLALFVIEVGTDIGFKESLGNSLGKFFNDVLFSIKPKEIMYKFSSVLKPAGWCNLQEYVVQFQHERVIHLMNEMIIKSTLEEQQQFGRTVLKFRKVGQEYLVQNAQSPLVGLIRSQASNLMRIIYFDEIKEEQVQSFETVSKINWMWDVRLLRICSKYSNLECFKMMEQLVEMNGDGFARDLGNLLSEAVISGNSSVFNYLVQDRKVKREVWAKEVHEEGSLVHNCVLNSRCDSSLVIEGKRKIIQFFSNASPSLINGVDKRGRTPLLMENIHIDLLKELILAGANVNAVEITMTKNNILHFLADCESGVSSKDFHVLLLLFAQNTGFNLKLQNKKGDTSLHIALTKFDPLPETLEVYAASGLGFETRNEVGNTLLLIAAKFGRSRETLDALIEHGATVEARNNGGETFLHFLAQTSDLSTFKHFLEKTGTELLMSKTGEENTVLHFAFANKCSKNMYEITDFLINEVGMDPSMRNANGATPLLFGIRHGKGNLKVTVFQALEKAGADILGKDKEETIISLFVHGQDYTDSEMLDICRFLKYAGANFQCRWGDGVTLLHWGVRRRSLSVVTFLVEECGVDIKSIHKSTGNNALHLVFEDKHIGLYSQDVALYLIEKGVDETHKNNWDEDPIEYSASLERGLFWDETWQKSYGSNWYEYLL